MRVLTRRATACKILRLVFCTCVLVMKVIHNSSVALQHRDMGYTSINIHLGPSLRPATYDQIVPLSNCFFNVSFLTAPEY